MLCIGVLVYLSLRMIRPVFLGFCWVFSRTWSWFFASVGDVLIIVTNLIANVIMVPLVIIATMFGRWQAADRLAETLGAENIRALNACWYLLVRRPLHLVCLWPIRPATRPRPVAPATPALASPVGEFPGYVVQRTLPPGGSGARLVVACPTREHQESGTSIPDLVVIKSFHVGQGSTLPQIVRESRSLEAARSLGLVLEHELDQERFYYVMPYHEGETINAVTRSLHAATDGQGLQIEQLRRVLEIEHDLVHTLCTYHREGLWHKDVKPENVIVTPDRAWLVDLGLITPLRSEMTLTTHGTEYFRDPEMVRQALRGVKVHQVDGALFDVYGAGAVLYFMMENTFPAHGVLSRFDRRSPEVVRWIIRRAMTDYAKRYQSAESMLADLAAVMASEDPYVLVPADLPSLRGSAKSGAEKPAHRPLATPASTSHAARSPRSNITAGFGSAVSTMSSRVRQAATTTGSRLNQRLTRGNVRRFVGFAIVLLSLGFLLSLIMDIGSHGTSGDHYHSLARIERSTNTWSRIIPVNEYELAATGLQGLEDLHPSIGDGARLIVVNETGLATGFADRTVRHVLDALSQSGCEVVLEDISAQARLLSILAIEGDLDDESAVTRWQVALKAGGYTGMIWIARDTGPSGDAREPLMKVVVPLEPIASAEPRTRRSAWPDQVHASSAVFCDNHAGSTRNSHERSSRAQAA